MSCDNHLNLHVDIEHMVQLGDTSANVGHQEDLPRGLAEHQRDDLEAAPGVNGDGDGSCSSSKDEYHHPQHPQ